MSEESLLLSILKISLWDVENGKPPIRADALEFFESDLCTHYVEMLGLEPTTIRKEVRNRMAKKVAKRPARQTKDEVYKMLEDSKNIDPNRLTMPIRKKGKGTK